MEEEGERKDDGVSKGDGMEEEVEEGEEEGCRGEGRMEAEEEGEEREGVVLRKVVSDFL